MVASGKGEEASLLGSESMRCDARELRGDSGGEGPKAALGECAMSYFDEATADGGLQGRCRVGDGKRDVEATGCSL